LFFLPIKCPGTSRSLSLRRRRLTAVARGSALSLDPPPVAIGPLPALLATQAAISCPSSPAAAVAAAVAAGEVSQLTSASWVTTLATTLAMTRATPAVPAATAAATLHPVAAAGT
jgi:hypothetical protein